MKENYRGYVLEYSATARGAPTGGYVLNASAYPPCSRGQVPPMHLEQLSSASSSKEALRHAQAEAQSLVDKAASNTFTNEELAAHQLQRALILFFEDGDFLSAVTLAHAAYIIFVKVGVKPGEPDHREQLADMIIEVSAQGSDRLTRKEAIGRISGPANALKHFDGDGRPPGMPFQASIVDVAADFLDLAVLEAFRVTQRETPLMQRFKEWQMQQWGLPSGRGT